jgi:hypothetical protein
MIASFTAHDPRRNSVRSSTPARPPMQNVETLEPEITSLKHHAELNKMGLQNQIA